MDVNYIIVFLWNNFADNNLLKSNYYDFFDLTCCFSQSQEGTSILFLMIRGHFVIFPFRVSWRFMEKMKNFTSITHTVLVLLYQNFKFSNQNSDNNFKFFEAAQAVSTLANWKQSLSVLLVFTCYMNSKKNISTMSSAINEEWLDIGGSDNGNIVVNCR